MRTLQLTYPFQQTILSNVTYLQIGVQYPYTAPMSEFLATKDPVTLKINGDSYIVPFGEILEFGDVNFQTLNFQVSNNPFLIIDLAYEVMN